jgi:predicted small secreted protein
MNATLHSARKHGIQSLPRRHGLTARMFSIIGLLIMVALLGSCRTTRGLGSDIKHLGAKIEHEAAKHD